MTPSLALSAIRAALQDVPGYTTVVDDNAVLARRTRVVINGATSAHVAALRAAGYAVEVTERPVRSRTGEVIRTRCTVAVVAP